MTTVVVRDNMNRRNYDTINIEVTTVSSLTWLEDHSELEKNHTKTLNVIALDKYNRKFTNCTAIHAFVEVKGEGILTNIPIQHSYDNIRSYVHENKELLFLS